MLEHDYEVPLNKCRLCDAELDQATGMADDGPPDADSVTFCIACGAISMFTADLTQRQPTADEFDMILADDNARYSLSALWQLLDQLHRDEIARGN